MEKIHQRKSETDTGPHSPQELSHLHDNEGTKRTTSTMDARTKSIKLQNRIPTRKERRKARRPHKKRRRPTHSRRQETHSKRGDPTAKGTILEYPRNGRNQTRRIGNNGIPRQERERNTEGKQGRQRDSRYQEKLGRRKKRNEGNSVGAMPMEGRPLMVSRKDLDTKGRRNMNHAYRSTSRTPTGGTWRNGKNYRTHQSTILLAEDKRRY